MPKIVWVPVVSPLKIDRRGAIIVPPPGLERGIHIAAQKKSGKHTSYEQKLAAIREVQEKKRHKQEVAEELGIHLPNENVYSWNADRYIDEISIF